MWIINIETIKYDFYNAYIPIKYLERDSRNLKIFTNKAGGYNATRAYQTDFSAAKPTFGFAAEIFRSYYVNAKDGTTTYKDYEYGEVKIVASSRNLACGSIVRFNSSRVGEGEQFAIVLDRGVGGYALDLLTPSEDYASRYIGRSQITYDVLRSGWE